MAAYVDSKYGVFQQRDYTPTSLPNKSFTKNIPATRAEGRLSHCVAYRQFSYSWWKHQTGVEILDK